MKQFSFDTETFLIPARDGLQQGKQTINLSPYKTPKLVLGSVADHTGYKAVLGPAPLYDALCAALADPEVHILCHNFPFDCDVMCVAFPDLWPRFRRALEAGRCHDTKVLDMRYGLARGYYDTPNPDDNWSYPNVRGRSLKDLAAHYLNKEVSKDLTDEAGDKVRLSFSKWDGVPISDIPRVYLDYALEDAAVTLDVWNAIAANAPADLWGEPAEVRSEVAFHAMDKVGVRVDRAEAQRLQALFSKDVPELQEVLVEAGLGEWLPVPGTIKREKFAGEHRRSGDTVPGRWYPIGGEEIGRWKCFKQHAVYEQAQRQFHLLQNTVRDRLRTLAAEMSLPFKETAGGSLSLVAEEWKDVVPADNEPLQAWLRHERLKKILGTYLRLYSQVDQVFPRMFSTGACTGRSSSSCPNIQNVSKRKHGIRSLIIPRPGMVFVKADYSFQELVTLAQAMLDIGIKGPLFDAIQKGDPHTMTAALLMGVDPKTIGKKSPERQAAKAVNFGVPGGLGAAKLVDYGKHNYNVVWTLEEARSIRSRFLQVYPDIVAYLEYHKTSLDQGLVRVSGRGIRYWMAKLGCLSIKALRDRLATTPDRGLRRMFHEAEHSVSVRLRNGFVRSKCAFTEGSNTRFQGLAAAVSKEANYRTHAGLLAAGHGARPVLMVHDEIVAETALDFLAETRTILENSMLSAFRDICPDTGPFAQVEIEGPLDKWGRATDKNGKDI